MTASMTKDRSDTRPRSKKTQWKQDPEAVKADILRVATDEFAAHGLSGGRIDEIARRTKASKRMIYYYFGDKEGLYRAVLEGVYTSLRRGEQELDFSCLGPVDALSRLVEATFDAHAAAPHFVRLVMIENIHNAEFLKKSETIPGLNRTVIDTLEAICARGKAEGVFRADVDAVELHWFISSISFYNISNRGTFSVSFGDALYAPERQERLKRRLVEMVLASVLTEPAKACNG